jgi:hypothetical protein
MFVAGMMPPTVLESRRDGMCDSPQHAVPTGLTEGVMMWRVATNMPFLRNFQETFRSTDNKYLTTSFSVLPAWCGCGNPHRAEMVYSRHNLFNR